MTEQERATLQRVNLRVKGKILKAKFQQGEERVQTLHSALVDYGMLLLDMRYN